MRREPDPLLRRLQLGAIVWCVGLTMLALVFWPGRWDVAAGILGGGVLTGVSFLAIKTSIDALLGVVSAEGSPVSDQVDGDPAGRTPEARRVAARALVKLVGRYGLLAVLAYVMIARLRLHPIGLVVGASSLVASASFEAARWVRGSRPGPPRVS